MMSKNLFHILLLQRLLNHLKLVKDQVQLHIIDLYHDNIVLLLIVARQILLKYHRYIVKYFFSIYFTRESDEYLDSR
jgi:hypothetical protein